VHPNTVSLAELQSAGLGPADALLQFVLGEEASFLWVITRERVRAVRLAPRGVLSAECERLAEALDPAGALGTSFIAPARRLYELLLAPVASELAAKSRLILVPDDFLAFVPFEALLVRDSQGADANALPFLVREKCVVYEPSASFWCRPRAKQAGVAPGAALLVGDPLYSQAELSEGALAMRAAAALRPERLQRLEGTRHEVLAIAAGLLASDEAALGSALRSMPRSGELRGERFTLLLGDQATRTRVLGALDGKDLLHFAVHGYVDGEYPWFSGLALAGEEGAPCSFLSLTEIATLSLDARLVFLSACETARGAVVRSEGIKNTARAFLLAGAEEVVATQWTVSDEAAAYLAESFYRSLARHSSVAEALRQAKLAMLAAASGSQAAFERGITRTRPTENSRPFAHPSLWAPFVAWGGGGSDG
jgi:CHAT domain-containing protein